MDSEDEMIMKMMEEEQAFDENLREHLSIIASLQNILDADVEKKKRPRRGGELGVRDDRERRVQDQVPGAQDQDEPQFHSFQDRRKLGGGGVERLGKPEESYDDFTTSLPADDCRYAVFLYFDGVEKSTIFFLSWSPDTSRVRSKMIYASTEDRFKTELDGVEVELKATDPSEMGLEVVKSRAP
ncbi:hypothetical protein ACQ4PT_054353 [Festuca glaucescens]